MDLSTGLQTRNLHRIRHSSRFNAFKTAPSGRKDVSTYGASTAQRAVDFLR